MLVEVVYQENKQIKRYRVDTRSTYLFVRIKTI